MKSRINSDTKIQQNRMIYIDVLNILACIAVIALHHNGLVHHYEPSLAWKESLVIECAFYWAVPVFMMITGATLLDYRKKYDTRTYFRKRILKTVIPWLAWSLIALIWKAATSQLILDQINPIYIADLILNNKVENVYWFFGALFACYLAIPVFSCITDRKNMLWYTVFLSFIFASCFPVLKTWFGFQWTLDIPVVGSLMIYVLLGYLLANIRLTSKIKHVIYVCGGGGLLFRLIYTYYFSVQKQETDTSIKGYTIFHAVFLSVAVFVWIKSIYWEKYISQRAARILTKVSSCSFGIYLIHRFVMYYEGQLLNLNTKSHIWRIGFIPVTYFIALGIVMILKKIPGIKRIVP